MSHVFYSIIVPVFNAQDSIEDCLDSVCAQTFKDWELIIVNDGSEDRSRAIMENFLQEQSGISYQIINQENLGLGASRNRAIATATGSYCAFLDADDLWEEHKLESCYQYLSRDTECDVLYHAVDNFGLKENRPRKVFALNEAQDILDKGLPIVPSAAILKRETALKFPFQTDPAFHGAEDLYLWLELLAAHKHFCYWPEAKSYYREDGGMSTRLEEHLKKVEAVYEHFHEQGLYPRTSFEKAMQRKFYEAARFCQKRGLHHRAHHYYSAADSRSFKILGLRLMNFLGLKW